ncbi:delta 1-pyrroline-5-carboxylate reductase [Varicellaria rhodocarpa]|nr:delta 1-pyrroline-5-carboxylate reductase [Varicellaria rhodocarpa]
MQSSGASNRDISDRGMTLTILGCGTLGTAILSGILSSLSDLQNTSSTSSDDKIPSHDQASLEDVPPRIPTRFIACVTSESSASRIRKALPDQDITILQNENLRGIHESDVVLLGCKPQKVKSILGHNDIAEALYGKLLISILAGVPTSQIQGILAGATLLNNYGPKGFQIVRAMPNTASFIRESMTVIATSTPPLPKHLDSFVTWIFTSIGRVVHLPPEAMDASTALCGSGPAFFALVLEAIADGAVAMGIPRAQAQLMAAQTMKGTAALVLNGEHPVGVREKVMTPGGCTSKGLLVMEDGNLRSTLARGLEEATIVASGLGKKS